MRIVVTSQDTKHTGSASEENGRLFGSHVSLKLGWLLGRVREGWGGMMQFSFIFKQECSKATQLIFSPICIQVRPGWALGLTAFTGPRPLPSPFLGSILNSRRLRSNELKTLLTGSNTTTPIPLVFQPEMIRFRTRQDGLIWCRSESGG